MITNEYLFFRRWYNFQLNFNVRLNCRQAFKVTSCILQYSTYSHRVRKKTKQILSCKGQETSRCSFISSILGLCIFKAYINS